MICWASNQRVNLCTLGTGEIQRRYFLLHGFEKLYFYNTKIRQRHKKSRIHAEKSTNMRLLFWQGQKDLNPRHVVLETTALPTELYPCIILQKTSSAGIIVSFYGGSVNIPLHFFPGKDSFLALDIFPVSRYNYFYVIRDN